jgi:hypothetical protein
MSRIPRRERTPNVHNPNWPSALGKTSSSITPAPAQARADRHNLETSKKCKSNPCHHAITLALFRHFLHHAAITCDGSRGRIDMPSDGDTLDAQLPSDCRGMPLRSPQTQNAPRRAHRDNIRHSPRTPQRGQSAKPCLREPFGLGFKPRMSKNKDRTYPLKNQAKISFSNERRSLRTDHGMSSQSNP